MDMMLEEFKTIFDRPEKVKKLREVILDLAVRGKLVEQNPDDEPASVLLERIKEEKGRLVREKKIKKEKALSRISEEEKYFQLPKGWKWTRLNDICMLITDGTHSRPNYIDSGVPFLSVKDISSGEINLSNVKYISKEEHKRLIKRCNPEYGDILLTKIGTTGIAKVIDIKEEFSIFVSVALLKIFNKLIFNKYLEYTINSPLVKKQSEENTQGVGNKNLVLKYIKSFILPIPPLEEQKRIVEKVDSLMAFCDKLEEYLEKKVHYGELAAKSVFNSVGNVSSSEELEEMLLFIIKNFKDISLGNNAVKELKNCILQLAVQGKLVEQNPNDEPAEVLLERIREEKEKLIKEKKINKKKLPKVIDEKVNIPSGWKLVGFSDIIFDITYGTSKKCVYDVGNVAVLRIPNVSNGHLDLDDIKYTDLSNEELKRLSLKKGDLIIIRSNGSSEIVGRCTLINEDLHNYSFAGYLIRIRLDNRYIYSQYIYKVISSNYIREQIEPHLRTTTGVKNINSTEIGNLKIPIPPLEEQKRIVEKVDSLMSLCDQLEKKIEEQKEYSNKLMESAIKEMLQSISNKEEIVSKEIEKEDEISVTIS